MYIVPDMIDLGLNEGQEWPSEAHRIVASRLALCNPNVRTRDRLTEIVQKVIKIPQDRIENVTVGECVDEFQIPI